MYLSSQTETNMLITGALYVHTPSCSPQSNPSYTSLACELSPKCSPTSLQVNATVLCVLCVSHSNGLAATTAYLKPASLPIPSYDLSTRPLSVQDDPCIPDFEPFSPTSSSKHAVIDIVLRETNLYSILDLPLYHPTTSLADKTSLRRAYLSRSRACHPESVLPPSSLHFLTSHQQIPRLSVRDPRLPKSLCRIRRTLLFLFETRVRRQTPDTPISHPRPRSRHL